MVGFSKKLIDSIIVIARSDEKCRVANAKKQIARFPSFACQSKGFQAAPQQEGLRQPCRSPSLAVNFLCRFRP